VSTITFLGNFRVDYTTETHHVKSLQSLGHKVNVLQESEATASMVKKAALASDLFVWVHTHGWETKGDMEEVLSELSAAGIPTMTYHLDLWLGLRRQRDLDSDPIYKNIGHFFTVDKQMAEWFNSNTNVKGHYLQAGVYGEECQLYPQRFSHDVIFVGSKRYHAEWPYRPKLIDWLGNTYGKRFQHWGGDGLGTVRGAKLNKLYGSTKVVVGDTLCPNFDYQYYWSDRIYETIGRGGFIIHPYIKGLEEEFVNGEHCVFYEYNNFEELNRLIDYYLSHDSEREKIRRAGHELVKERYTYKNRWQHIIEELKI
jgi:hypothetical protein